MIDKMKTYEVGGFTPEINLMNVCSSGLNNEICQILK